jgi:hypothetical protein
MGRLARWHVALGLALVVGTVAWLALVPNDGDGGNARHPGYWWLCIAAAIALGWFAASNQSAIVGAAVAVPAIVLAPWTAPRGDEDGLWLLWFPILFVFMVGLAVAGFLGGRVGARRRRA